MAGRPCGLPTNQHLQAGQGKIPPRALGSAGDSPVGEELVRRDIALGGEEFDQSGQTFHLGAGRFGLLKIAHQADADAVQVMIIAGSFAMGAGSS